MFNLGFTELLLLGAIALIFIGPKQLPDVARTLGRFLNELKRASSDFQETLTAPIKEDVQKRITEHRHGHNEHHPEDDAHKIAPHEMGSEAITTPFDQPKPEDKKHES